MRLLTGFMLIAVLTIASFGLTPGAAQAESQFLYHDSIIMGDPPCNPNPPAPPPDENAPPVVVIVYGGFM